MLSSEDTILSDQQSVSLKDSSPNTDRKPQQKSYRTRFNLMNDLCQTNPIHKNKQQQSAMSIYLRQLQERKPSSQKQQHINKNKQTNTPQMISFQVIKDKKRQINNQNIRQTAKKNQNTIEHNETMNSCKMIDSYLKTSNNQIKYEENMKAGIFKYKKKINLLENIDSKDLKESFYPTYNQNKFNMINSIFKKPQRQDKLFQKALLKNRL